ncbi:MAG: diaminopimelate epimerase [Gammaproteobacteria bacterium]|nr:diaminopimelate epimerase [Gammaproteobacteria bacterium]NNC57109.1 diaminopimelate epimerase [Woeseiaceae bacterium]NNL50844.1 diaminopimelate epimerase [Woeseiaceae bacterium]
MQVAYVKMQGTGNKILVVDQRRNDLPPPDASSVRELGDDATGPGFDQLMWVAPARDPGHAASYRVFNADGTEVEQCGNGVRCVASLLSKEGRDNTAITLESPAGLISAEVRDDGRVAVSMGAPEFEPRRIPFIADARAPFYTLSVAGRDIDVLVLSMGNPHCVLRVPDVSTAEVADLGPRIEHHERFPQRANVGFMTIRGRTSIDLRVHERGVGETLACGTGACAAVVAGQQLGLLDDEVDVRLPGGQVVVSWRGGTEAVWLTGNAELISEGTLDV